MKDPDIIFTLSDKLQKQISFLPTFSTFGPKKFSLTLINLISLKICHLQSKNKICFIKIEKLGFYQLIW